MIPRSCDLPSRGIRSPVRLRRSHRRSHHLRHHGSNRPHRRRHSHRLRHHGSNRRRRHSHRGGGHPPPPPPPPPPPGGGFGFVDAQGTAHELSALEAINGPVFRLGIGHFHKGEAPLAAGVPLKREGTIRYVAVGGEELHDVFLLSAEGEIANKNAH